MMQLLTHLMQMADLYTDRDLCTTRGISTQII